jgi:hypothetical protein
VGVISQSMYTDHFGALASVGQYQTMMLDPTSQLSKNSVVSAAYSDLLQRDAPLILSDTEKEAIASKLSAVSSEIADGTVHMSSSSDPSASPMPLASADPRIASILQGNLYERTLLQDLAKSSDPNGAIHSFIATAIQRHVVTFSPVSGVSVNDLLAYAGNGGPSWS